MPDNAPPPRGADRDLTERAPAIRLRGVRQNNLRGVDLDVPHGQITVVTGPSGSGKSSLAFDTLYAEGQRRYVECLSSYARQFLERMDKPHAESIEGILPSVALEQGKRLKASRSTVATLTELSEYFKVLFASAADLVCPHCGVEVERHQAPEVVRLLLEHAAGRRAVLTFPLRVASVSAASLALESLARGGYHRHWQDGAVHALADLQPGDWVGRTVHVVQDRIKVAAGEQLRVFDSVDDAMRRGDGTLDVWLEGDVPPELEPWALAAATQSDEAKEASARGAAFSHLRATAAERCPNCAGDLPRPRPNLFSFNAPMGACQTCNGFGRTVGVDINRCIPDPTKTLARGALKPWSTPKTRFERKHLREFAEAADIRLDVPWQELSAREQKLVLDGKTIDGKKFWGLHDWFAWLEGRTYRMHVRVLLARYRHYVPCPDCGGARLNKDARAFRLHGRSLPDWYRAPLSDVASWLRELDLEDGLRIAVGQALDRPLEQVRLRVGLLEEVGLGYLSLDRAGRTLSGGELQRVQLVGALASGLSQVLYVLDEPSVGLHPRDGDRLIGILERLREAGNTVVVVEHDPAIMRAADRIVDMGPGAGERGGQIVFDGPPEALKDATGSLTADYLLGRRSVLGGGAGGDGGAADGDGDGATRAAPDAVLGRARKKTVKGRLQVLAPSARNLKGDDVSFALGQLNVVCGVSGSGKSTLVDEVLYRGLLRQRGEPTDTPGDCAGIEADARFRDVVLVEQAPLSSNSRANCATYLKVWNALRDRLAAEPLAVQRGYDKAYFSFNRKAGRCEACEGTGLQIVDMQFLSDVRITCEVCGGKRFVRSVLEVRHRGLSAADMLEMTAEAAAAHFADDDTVARPLQAMVALGLGYLRLGQPLSTLSGGEAQRLKIAHHLMCAKTRETLFLLDEPSTGLHLDDVRVLLENLRRLTARGNTVIVIEHHLDVISAAHRVIELGPDGGPGGGHVLFEGTPAQLKQAGDTPTARYLRAEDEAELFGATIGETAVATPAVDLRHLPLARDPGHIEVHGARVHNLREVRVDVPREGMTVVTGLSGSGKSSLAFDVVFSEGQRRFLDCLSPYARQYLPPVIRPDVDALNGLPPTVAIAQRTTRGGTLSTVATLTDVASYIRLLYARIGVRVDPDTGARLERQPPEELAAEVIEALPAPDGAELHLLVSLISGRKGHHREVMEKAADRGARYLRVDGRRFAPREVPELARYNAHDIEEVIASVVADEANRMHRADGAPAWQADAIEDAIARAVEAGKGDALAWVVDARTGEPLAEPLALFGLGGDKRPEPLDPLLFSFSSRRGRCERCHGRGVEPDPEALEKREKKRKKMMRSKRRRAELEREEKDPSTLQVEDVEETDVSAARLDRPCTACGGSRLRPEALAVHVDGESIDRMLARTPGALADRLEQISWRTRDGAIAGPIVREVVGRCRFLEQIGLGYLGLDRGATTLSGGESQRIRLAAQLGSNLTGVLYVLDEPTIGLHHQDNQRVLQALEQLADRGNGLLVVEHDQETIRRADHLIELGPGGGERGGQIVFSGDLKAMLDHKTSATGRALRDGILGDTTDVGGGEARQPRDVSAKKGPFVTLRGARRNNLRDVDVRFARHRFNVVSGVSGSGKSTLVRDLLVQHGNALLRGDLDEATLAADPDSWGIVGIDGLGPEVVPGKKKDDGSPVMTPGIGRLIEVDQSPIGRTPRSCPATYLKVFDPIRKLFAQQRDAKVLGLDAGHFSFNVARGRCPSCAGAGTIKLEMSFLPTVYMPCDACEGRRYTSQTLQVRYGGATIADVLEMSIAEAAGHFRSFRKIHEPLAMATKVGLGYLRLGQGSNTLSGGEAQRIKIVAELAKRRREETLYVLDEPSTGLHPLDLARLLTVLHELVDRGDTLIVIEHDLDVLRSADWLVDLGPGPGEQGGAVVHEGTVEALRKARGKAKSDAPTAVALRA